FRRRIEMAQRAADRAPVARLTMAYLQQGLVHDRPARAHRLGKFEIALARHRADFERIMRAANVGQPVDAVEIDDVMGEHESEVEHGHQRLAARKQLGVLQAVEQSDGLADRFRVVVAEGRRLHGWGGAPLEGASFYKTPTLPPSQKTKF